MAFMMPVLIRFSCHLVLLLLIPTLSLAKDSGVFIKNLNVNLHQQHYLLNADVQFELSPTVEQALRNGVTLVWAVHFKVWGKRQLFWDSELVNITHYYRMRYHTLLDRFQIMDEQSHTLERFISLSAAFSQLGKIQRLSLIAKKFLTDEGVYEVGLQVALDKERLPLALRAQAYINPDWSLSSQWQRRLLN